MNMYLKQKNDELLKLLKIRARGMAQVVQYYLVSTRPASQKKKKFNNKN
jgi:hypothetical protein